MRPNLVATAVGGVWKFDREVQPLFEFLARKVDTGDIMIGGLDFQVGGLDQPYSNVAMMEELTIHLPPERRRFCREAYGARVNLGTLPPGTDQSALPAALIACLTEARSGMSVAQAENVQPQIANLEAWLSAAATDQPGLVRARDKMMADNAARIIDGLGRRAKVVIWTHNAHAARTSAFLSDYAGADTLGSALSRRYGTRVYALGITARKGSFRWSRRINKPLPQLLPNALEAIGTTSKQSATTLIDARMLRRQGSVPAGLIFHAFQTFDWSYAYDGVLVLDGEHPPESTRPN